MQLHQLKTIKKKKRVKRIGRGGKRGTYSGRGMKGQKSRAGRRMQPVIREIIKRYPKLRGYRVKSRFKNKKEKPVVLNLEVLEKNFNLKEKIIPQLLLEKKLIRRIKGRTPIVKILGKGKLTKILIIEGCEVSKSARGKIEKAGGTIISNFKSQKPKSYLKSQKF